MKLLLPISLLLASVAFPATSQTPGNLPANQVFAPIPIVKSGTPTANSIPCGPQTNSFGECKDSATGYQYMCDPGSGAWVWSVTNSASKTVLIGGPTTSPPTVATTIFTTPAGANQVYRICANLIVTTAGTGGSVFPALGFTASGHAYTGINYTQSGVGLSGGSVPVAAQWNSGSGCFTFMADAATVVQAWLGLGGVTGTPAYSYVVELERIQ